MDLILCITAAFMGSYITLQRIMTAWDIWHESTRLHIKNTWMRESCQNISFYANMQMHSDVCDRVQKQASRTPLMHAMQAFWVIDTHLTFIMACFIVLIFSKCVSTCIVYKKNVISLPI